MGGKYGQYMFTHMLYYILLHAQVIVSSPTNYPLPIFQLTQAEEQLCLLFAVLGELLKFQVTTV